MALKRLPLLVFCAAILCAPASPQPLGRGVISGTVVEGEGDEGVRKAIVTLTLEGEPPQWATARTDGSGHFQFDGLPAGKYTLRATKDNEGAAIYGAKSVRELGDVITLADGEIRGGLTLRFLRGASIEGRVFDTDGEPATDAGVVLLRRGRNRGQPTFMNYRAANPDDRGEYRFTNIDPGRYYIRVSPGGRRFAAPSREERIPVEQYYGGARDPKDASPIHLNGGDHLTGIDFHLTSEPAVNIRGQVLGVPDEPQPDAQSGQTPLKTSGAFVVASGGVGRRRRAVEVQISRSDEARVTWTQGVIAQGADYRFDIPGVPAGRYHVEARFESGGKNYGASQTVDLHSGSADLALTLAPAVDMHGTLQVEGQGKQAAAGGFHVRMQKAGVVGHMLTAQVGADGRFTVAQVTPGEWSVEVNPVPPGFVKSVRLGDKDVLFATFEAGVDKDAALNIVVSMKTAVIEGEIDAGSSDAARSGIVVARADQYHTFTRFYYRAEADADGKFHVNGIAPGKYKIFALEKMRADDFQNPEAVDQLDELGETVDLAEGARVKAHPKLIPQERAEKAVE